MGETQETGESQWGQEEWVKESLAALARTSVRVLESGEIQLDSRRRGWGDLNCRFKGLCH